MSAEAHPLAESRHGAGWLLNIDDADRSRSHIVRLLGTELVTRAFDELFALLDKTRRE